MRYLAEFIVQIVVAFVVLYSGAWFYFSGKVEDQARIVLEKIGEDITAHNPYGRLFHGDIRVSGYPFYMKVEVDQLRIKTDFSSDSKPQASINSDIYFDNILFIESQIFGNKTYIHLPRSIGFILTNNNKNNLEKLNDLVVENGIVEIELKKTPIEYFIDSGEILTFTHEKLQNDLVSLRYSDDGLEIFAPKGEIPYFKSDGNKIYTTSGEAEGDKFIREMKFSSSAIDVDENFAEEFLKGVVGLYPEDKEKLKEAAVKLSQSGKIYYDFDSQLISKDIVPISLYEGNIVFSDFEFNINKISMKNDLYSFNIDGDISRSSLDKNSLEGTINIDFGNYKEAVSEWYKVISFLFNINEASNDEVLKALEKAADVAEGAKDMSLKIERGDEREFNIGKITLSEFMELFSPADLRSN